MGHPKSFTIEYMFGVRSSPRIVSIDIFSQITGRSDMVFVEVEGSKGAFDVVITCRECDLDR